MSIRITCIKKSNGYHLNPYTAIESLGWIEDGTGNTGNTDRVEIYEWVKKGGYAYVKDSKGNSAKLIHAETSTGTKYVKTVADETKTDNLLQLPECK
jgi:hypothetical protein